MPERKIHSLLQVCTSIKKSIEQATQGRSFWIRAEIANFRAPGHVYMELVQHIDGVKVATMRGIIWSNAFEAIQYALGNELNNVVKEGSEIMFLASARFHEVYGLSLLIEEIDLSFSLGELERRKKETIEALKKEGLFDLNRSVHEPMVIQRIALITSRGSAAYQDFMHHLGSNEHGYRFHVRVFSAAVQGEGAAKEIGAALHRVDPTLFDAVVIIRGGGSKLDLEPFNDLELCRLVARMPIPVMTGIGHQVDVSVMDMIAKSPHNTPTAIADHLVDKCLFFETGMNLFLDQMFRIVTEAFAQRKERLAIYGEMLSVRPKAKCQTIRGALHADAGQLARTIMASLVEAKAKLEVDAANLRMLPVHKLDRIERAKVQEIVHALKVVADRGSKLLLKHMEGMDNAIRLLAPETLLARGFSITRTNGKAITDPVRLHVGDHIETTFANGRTISTINTIERDG